MSRLKQHVAEPALSRRTITEPICVVVAVDCEERETLVNAFRIASEEYSRTADRTRRTAGIHDERAWKRCEEARSELANHLWDHGCQFGPSDFYNN